MSTKFSCSGVPLPGCPPPAQLTNLLLGLVSAPRTARWHRPGSPLPEARACWNTREGVLRLPGALTKPPPFQFQSTWVVPWHRCCCRPPRPQPLTRTGWSQSLEALPLGPPRTSPWVTSCAPGPTVHTQMSLNKQTELKNCSSQKEVSSLLDAFW